MLIIIIILILINGFLIFQLSTKQKTDISSDLKEQRFEQNKILSNAINIIEHKVSAMSELNMRQTKDNSDSLDKRIYYQNQELMQTIEKLEKNVNQEVVKSSENVQKISEKMIMFENVGKQIGSLEQEINGLKSILGDKQMRGAYGEIRLQEILTESYGVDSNLVNRQDVLSNNKRADFSIKLPGRLNKLIIDAKFPLENYQKLIETEDVVYEREFFKDVEKHIKAISEKYIIEDETAPFALMFIPSEAIYYYLLKQNANFLSYGYRNNVWITSPSTVLAFINLMNLAIRDVRRNEMAEQMQKQIGELRVDFIRFEKRWFEYEKRQAQLLREKEALDITAHKIIKKFNQINEE